MPLTDTRIRQAKPKQKSYKLTDGGGLHVDLRRSRADNRAALRPRSGRDGSVATTRLRSVEPVLNPFVIGYPAADVRLLL